MFVFPCSRPFACPQAWSPIGIYRSSPSICIYRPWSTILLPVRGLIFCIYRPCLLNLCLYLRSWPTICIIGPGPEFTFTLLLVVVAVVAVIVVVVISLEQIIPIFICRFQETRENKLKCVRTQSAKQNQVRIKLTCSQLL